MFNLTINAVPASTIIVGRRATWLDRHAAEELRDYVKKISGTILNIADETLTMAVTGNRILIGRPSTSDLVKNFADQNPGILPAESDTENDCLAIVQRGEVLVLSGSNDRSVYYSVCHLLQTVFHVGFYWDRDVYEANPDMTVPDNLTIVERSAFKFRHTIGQWVYNHGAFLNEAERREELDKYARNKINSYRLYSWNSYARKMTFIKLGVPGIEIKPEDIARRDIIRDTIEYAQSLADEGRDTAERGRPRRSGGTDQSAHQHRGSQGGSDPAPAARRQLPHQRAHRKECGRLCHCPASGRRRPHPRSGL